MIASIAAYEKAKEELRSLEQPLLKDDIARDEPQIEPARVRMALPHRAEGD